MPATSNERSKSEDRFCELYARLFVGSQGNESKEAGRVATSILNSKIDHLSQKLTSDETNSGPNSRPIKNYNISLFVYLSFGLLEFSHKVGFENKKYKHLTGENHHSKTIRKGDAVIFFEIASHDLFQTFSSFSTPTFLTLGFQILAGIQAGALFGFFICLRSPVNTCTFLVPRSLSRMSV
jgi:hypothetical protein